MLLLVCSRYDRTAQDFAEGCARRDVQLVTCATVAQRGWELRVGAGATVEACASIGGERVRAERIDGVITRLHAVSEAEMAHVVAGDRAYAAAEMHAFLFAFLDALSCPVANRPSPACLCGPNLRRRQWRQLARELDIPVFDDRRDAERTLEDGEWTEVAVVADRPLSAAPDHLQRWTQELARGLGLSYLLVRYAEQAGRFAFVDADPRPRLESAAVAAALLERFGVPEGIAC